MRTPKPPIGFVPVDSEEAKGIDDEARVNSARIADGSWIYEHAQMKTVRDMRCLWPDDNHHVQLPPAVEWEEVWGITSPFPLDYRLTKKGVQVADLSKLESNEVTAIVRALNEMENQ